MAKFEESLRKILDEQFPKKGCKERGKALVLFAWACIFHKRRDKKLKKKK
jgi:hypothetical protein